MFQKVNWERERERKVVVERIPACHVPQKKQWKCCDIGRHIMNLLVSSLPPSPFFPFRLLFSSLRSSYLRRKRARIKINVSWPRRGGKREREIEKKKRKERRNEVRYFSPLTIDRVYTHSYTACMKLLTHTLTTSLIVFFFKLREIRIRIKVLSTLKRYTDLT